VPGRSPCAPPSLAQGVALPPLPPATTPSGSAYHRRRQNGPARTCGRANPIPPELPPSLRRATLAPSASVRAMVCSHLATSKSSTSSLQCRLISSAAFSSTAFDVHHARLYCSRADSPVVPTLQLLPHRARPSCTPTRSRPELAQRGTAMRCTSPPYTSSLCTSLPCTAPPPSPVAGPALAPTLLRLSAIRVRLCRVRPWPAPHMLRPPFFCSHVIALRPH
jgi:hypothetical protein